MDKEYFNQLNLDSIEFCPKWSICDDDDSCYIQQDFSLPFVPFEENNKDDVIIINCDNSGLEEDDYNTFIKYCGIYTSEDNTWKKIDNDGEPMYYPRFEKNTDNTWVLINENENIIATSPETSSETLSETVPPLDNWDNWIKTIQFPTNPFIFKSTQDDLINNCSIPKVTLTIVGNKLNYVSNVDIAGFQFDHGGCITNASGGEAAANGFTISISTLNVLGFSISGSGIQAGEGTLLTFENTCPINLSNFIFSAGNGEPILTTLDSLPTTTTTTYSPTTTTIPEITFTTCNMHPRKFANTDDDFCNQADKRVGGNRTITNPIIPPDVFNLSTSIEDRYFSSVHHNSGHALSLINTKGGWTHGKGDNCPSIIINTNRIQSIDGVMIQGNGADWHPTYVTKYTVEYSNQLADEYTLMKQNNNKKNIYI